MTSRSVLLVLTALGGAAALADPPVRLPGLLFLILFAPGVALVVGRGLLRGQRELVVVAVSVATATVVCTGLALAGAWSYPAAVASLVLLSTVATLIPRTTR